MRKNKSKGSSGHCAAKEDGTGRGRINWDRIILDMKKTTKEFVENVLANIIESIIMTDLDGYLVFFNKHSEEMFGFEAREVLNRHVVILGAVQPDVLGSIRRKETFNGEITLKTKEGVSFPAHVRCVPLCDEENQPIGMVGVARDLTREKEKQRIDWEVKRLEALNKNIVASLNDGIQIINLEGLITFVNKRLEILLNYEPGEMLGMHYSKVVSGEGHSMFERLIAAPDDASGELTFETNFIDKSGKKIRFWVSTSPLMEDSVPVGIIAALTDISEIQSLKEELFQSEKMSLVGTLASEVAHEINNPLGGLIMSVQMLLQDLAEGALDSNTAIRELREIENDARRCRNITQNLLSFSRRVPEEWTRLEIKEVIEDSLLLVQRQTELQDISFIKRYAEDILPIQGNRNRLQQVIINVIKNAQDAMSEGGRILVSTNVINGWNNSKWVRISIADTGPGIPSLVAESLFDPFVTTKEGSKGTGLGLAVSKRIVEDHGGHIQCENRKEGGAVFHIDFPPAGKKEDGMNSSRTKRSQGEGNH